jgi:hypothetical protein
MTIECLYLLEFFEINMRRFFLILISVLAFEISNAQVVYTMGYEQATIQVVDPNLFSYFELPGQATQCGLYDINSKTFYTCDYKTFRYIDEDYVKYEGNACCASIDFDPKKYYGTLTFKGVIDSVEWDAMIIHFVTDKARLTIHVDEREIDALYDNFYKKNALGKVKLLLRLNTYDTPNENVLSYNKNTEILPKPLRTETKILRW